MGRLIRITLRAILVTTVVTLWFAIVIYVCLVVPPMGLLEIFLAMAGSLVLAGGGVLLAREVSMLHDLRHWQSMRRDIRELELLKRKQAQIPFIGGRRRSSRDRYPYV